MPSANGMALPRCGSDDSGFSVSRSFAGTGTARAPSTSAPNPSRRPLAEWITSCFSVRTSVAATPQVVAAAASSIRRAVAPISRSGVRKSVTLCDPSVFCDPYAGSSPSACTMRTRDQSAPSSSASAAASVDRMPCPISERWTVMLTRPLASMAQNTLGTNGAEAADCAVTTQPSVRLAARPKAPVAASVSRKARRETERRGLISCLPGTPCGWPRECEGRSHSDRGCRPSRRRSDGRSASGSFAGAPPPA